MNIHMIDGKNGIIRNQHEFILIINEEFIGPILITPNNIQKVYNAIKNKGEL